MDPKLTTSVTRVLVGPDEAVNPQEAARRGFYPDVLFVRDDGWVLGAPNNLAADAHRMWHDKWVAVVQLPPRPEQKAVGLDDLLLAAKMLHADGTGAVITAGRHVGDNVARGMLAMFLWMQFTAPDTWPADEATSELVRQVLLTSGLFRK